MFLHPVTIMLKSDMYRVVFSDIYFDGKVASFPYRIGGFISGIYNLDINYIASKVIDTFSNYKGNTLDEYIKECFYNMSVNDGKSFDFVILILVLNELYAAIESESNNLPETADQRVAYVLTNYIGLKLVIKKYLSGKMTSSDYREMMNLQDGTIYAKFYLDDNGTVGVAYTLSEIYSLLVIDLLNVQSKKITIKHCANCGRLFIPYSRSDELYCDHIDRNGKTCKQVGYENKLKSDPFKSEYRKAYKTQHAKMKRNLKNIPNYKEKYFDPWVDAAKDKMKKCQAENNIDAFVQWINEHRN